MPNTIVRRIKEQVDRKQLDTTTAFGRAWLLQKMAKLNVTAQDRMEILRDRDSARYKTMLGRFYFFAYSPKTHEKLPWWDKFPMVVVLQRYDDGFLGLNLHYIYPKDRLILLQQLKRAATGPLTDERTRLKLTYPLLVAMRQAYRATPCIKRYLSGHVVSRYVEVQPDEWDIAAVLPAQNFTSKTHVYKEEVWKDSKEKY